MERGAAASRLRGALSLLLLLSTCQVGQGQIQSLRQKRQQPNNMPMITGLDVTCEKTGMTVNLEFSAPFNGVVFSKGHFSNPACRYVEPGGASSHYTFAISTKECGTELTSARNGEISSAENIIIIQMDPLVQEIWDSARRISCQWEDTYRKSIRFQPFSVGMLAVEPGEDTSNVNCWMDIRKGRFPQTRPLEGITKIGEPLSILIFLSDKGEGRFNVKAQDCWAYDSEYFEEATTTKVQLTTRDGCPVKEKLIGNWVKTRSVPKTDVKTDADADLILYNIVNAFKFPDNAQVYITCNVEICRGQCDNVCSPPTTTTRTTLITARPILLAHPGDPRHPKALDDGFDATTTKPDTVFFTTPRSVVTTSKKGIQVDASHQTTVRALSTIQFPGTTSIPFLGNVPTQIKFRPTQLPSPGPFSTSFDQTPAKSQSIPRIPFFAPSPPSRPSKAVLQPATLQPGSRAPASPLSSFPILRPPTGARHPPRHRPGVAGAPPQPFHPSPALNGAMFQPVIPPTSSSPRPQGTQGPRPSSPCFPGALNARCHHQEACRRLPNHPECKRYERCRMLQRQADCSQIVCRISPFSSQCSRRRPTVIGGGPSLPKLVRPCDPAHPDCTVGNFFPRPPDVFKMVPGVFQVVPGGFRPQTQDNQISSCKDGTLDPRCRQSKLTLNPHRPRQPFQLVPTTIPNQGVETPTMPSPVTSRPIKASHENKPTQSHGPQTTNGISNGPLNSFNPTLSPTPIKNNMVIPTQFKTGNPKNNNQLTRAPKQLAGDKATEPSVSTQVLCNQNPADGVCGTMSQHQTNCSGRPGCQEDGGHLNPPSDGPQNPASDPKSPQPDSQSLAPSPQESKPGPENLPPGSFDPKKITPGKSLNTADIRTTTLPDPKSPKDPIIHTVTHETDLSSAPVLQPPDRPHPLNRNPSMQMEKNPELPSSTVDPKLQEGSPWSRNPLPMRPFSLAPGPASRFPNPTAFTRPSFPPSLPKKIPMQNVPISRFPAVPLPPQLSTSAPKMSQPRLPIVKQFQPPQPLQPQLPVMPQAPKSQVPNVVQAKNPKISQLPVVPQTDLPREPKTNLPADPSREPSSPVGRRPMAECASGLAGCIELQEQHLCTNGFVGGRCQEQRGAECRDPGCQEARGRGDPACSGTSCQGPNHQPLPATDPIKIDNHDCPPDNLALDCATVPPRTNDAETMKPASPLSPGRTELMNPTGTPETPQKNIIRTEGLRDPGDSSREESQDPSHAWESSPLPTPSNRPSKANQPGMLNGANQEGPKIPEISLGPGHPARAPGTGPHHIEPGAPGMGSPGKAGESGAGGKEPEGPGHLAPCGPGEECREQSCTQENNCHPACPPGSTGCSTIQEPRHPKTGEIEEGHQCLPGTIGCRTDGSQVRFPGQDEDKMASCPPGSKEDECWPEGGEDHCSNGPPSCWPFSFSRETAGTCISNSDTPECQAFALTYQRYCNSHPVSPLCLARNTDPGPAGQQPSRPASGVTTSRPPIECSAGSRDPICRSLPAAVSPSQPPPDQPALQPPTISFLSVRPNTQVNQLSSTTKPLTPRPFTALPSSKEKQPPSKVLDKKQQPIKLPREPKKNQFVTENNDKLKKKPKNKLAHKNPNKKESKDADQARVNPNRSRKPPRKDPGGKGKTKNRGESRDSGDPRDPGILQGAGDPRDHVDVEEPGDREAGGQLGGVTGRPGGGRTHKDQGGRARTAGNQDRREEPTSRGQGSPAKPFLAFSRTKSSRGSPTTTRRPSQTVEGRPQARQPKQQTDEVPEPQAEPEASHHGKGGDPRTHAFHSWLYQKIDPKVREARRKKFFGSGRRRRDVSEDLLLEVFGDATLREPRTVHKETNQHTRYHAFHSWQYEKVDLAQRKVRRQKLWEQHHQPLQSLQPSQPIPGLHSVTKRAVPGGISINLGVKRIVIQDSVSDMLKADYQSLVAEKQQAWNKEGSPDVLDTLTQPSFAAATTFGVLLVALFVFLGFSFFFSHRRRIVRKV